MSSLKGRKDAIQAVVNLIKMKADAVIAMHRPGESADDVVDALVADGWTQREEVDHLLGKRIRYLDAPKESSE